MNRIAISAAAAAALLGLVACGEREATDNLSTAEAATSGEAPAAAGNGWVEGARIVEEDGATFRIDPDGTRVRLGAGDSVIAVENGVRYRVDPDGARIRIDDQGVDVDLDIPDVDVELPSVDVGDRDRPTPEPRTEDR
jgi:hypothetical protein